MYRVQWLELFSIICLIGLSTAKHHGHHSQSHHTDQQPECAISNLMEHGHTIHFRNSCFYFATRHKMLYQRARVFCKAFGGTLANVKSSAVNDFIKHELHKTFKIHNDYLWIGLNDMRKPNNYTWEDGTPMTYANFQHNHGPQRGWRETWPHCTVVNSRSGKWEDVSCSDNNRAGVAHHYPFVCEYPKRGSRNSGHKTTPIPTVKHYKTTTPKPPPTVSRLSDCPSHLPRDQHLAVFGTSCFLFQTSTKSHSDAEGICHQIGGNLANVKSKAVNDFIAHYSIKTLHNVKPFWIGLDDQKNMFHYEWSDGSQMSRMMYSNFDSNDYTLTQFMRETVDHCVVLKPRNGKWGIFPCQNTAFYWNPGFPYICEFPIQNLEQSTSTVHPKPTKRPRHTTVLPVPAKKFTMISKLTSRNKMIISTAKPGMTSVGPHFESTTARQSTVAHQSSTKGAFPRKPTTSQKLSTVRMLKTNSPPRESITSLQTTTDSFKTTRPPQMVSTLDLQSTPENPEIKTSTAKNDEDVTEKSDKSDEMSQTSESPLEDTTDHPAELVSLRPQPSTDDITSPETSTPPRRIIIPAIIPPTYKVISIVKFDELDN